MSRDRGLRQLAERAVISPEEAEAALFREAGARLLPEHLSHLRLDRIVRYGAANEAAICLYRHALPEFGFQFGTPPRFSDGSPARSITLAWRRQDRTAVPYRAATPALALLAAAAGESAKLHETGNRALCNLCFGLGWYFTPANEKAACRKCRK